MNQSEMFASLANQTAMVTGGSTGIGREIAIEFARAGARVVIHYASSVRQAEETARLCRECGVAATTMQADFLSTELDEFANQAWEQYGGFDVWVNNAGVDLLTGAGKDLSYEQKLKALLDVDVTASVLLSRRIGKMMQQQGHGSIINIGWDQADRGMEGDSAELFSVAKNAIMGFSRSLAVSLAPQVRVNCIAPGWIQTEWGDQASREWQNRVLQETPLKRWGKPHDIARLARYLVSDEAKYITGQVINANGGAIR